MYPLNSIIYVVLVVCLSIRYSESNSEARTRVIHHSALSGQNRERRMNESERTNINNNSYNVNRGGGASGSSGSGSSNSASINSNSNVEDNELLQRIYDKINLIQIIEDQQLKRLESIEYKLSRSEIANNDRNEELKSNVRDIVKRIENLDWVAAKLEAQIEQIRGETESLKQALQSNSRTNIANPQQNNVSQNFDQKLDALAVLLTSTRASVHRIERQVQTTGENVTSLITLNREINQLQKSLPSKQFLNNALVGLKNQPIYAVMQNSGTNQRNVNGIIGADSNTTLLSSCIPAPKRSGIYKIQIENTMIGPFYVNCEMENYGGGWTVIQTRLDGSVNFYRNWVEYKHGFGNLGGEFWIGLDKLHEITSSRLHELLVVLEDLDGQTKFARYTSFAIGGEKESYAVILLGTYAGNAGDSLKYHAGQKFSTFDLDNDAWPEGNCAQAHVGAWWYNACDNSNLNGRYLSGEVPEEMAYHGIYWNEFRGRNYSLAKTRMMIRPIE